MKNIITIIRNSINGFSRQLKAGANRVCEQKKLGNIYRQYHREKVLKERLNTIKDTCHL